MKVGTPICLAFLVLMPGAASSAEDATSKPATETASQTRECNSCTARHQALLKRKKEREKKRKDEATQKTKNAD